jgi:hypothetical protein
MNVKQGSPAMPETVAAISAVAIDKEDTCDSCGATRRLGASFGAGKPVICGYCIGVAIEHMRAVVNRLPPPTPEQIAEFLTRGRAAAADILSRQIAPDEDPPDEVHGPRSVAGLAYFEVEEINVAEWCPTPDGTGRPEQVHMTLTVKGFPNPFVMRFKSARTIGRLINNLRKHRDGVWPPE